MSPSRPSILTSKDTDSTETSPASAYLASLHTLTTVVRKEVERRTSKVEDLYYNESTSVWGQGGTTGNGGNGVPSTFTITPHNGCFSTGGPWSNWNTLIDSRPPKACFLQQVSRADVVGVLGEREESVEGSSSSSPSSGSGSGGGDEVIRWSRGDVQEVDGVLKGRTMYQVKNTASTRRRIPAEDRWWSGGRTGETGKVDENGWVGWGEFKDCKWEKRERKRKREEREE
ncbi:hypothetical protein TrRE_jg9091 [Triparma retinervis]|uniref:Uncharacterized protein n=1 Tax=Triparma retinervis TaxID=2557542 RepID=A0A9W7DLP1_9STRA|nr:hypothetical protein TrRE_jg9091 [Triparma retinervis]